MQKDQEQIEKADDPLGSGGHSLNPNELSPRDTLDREETKRTKAEAVLQRALEESRQRQDEVSALLAASRAVLSYRGFEVAARSIFDSCKRLTGATAGYVALLSSDGTENEVLFLDSGGVACTIDPSFPMPIRGLREQVYQTGQTVYENDFLGAGWVRFIPCGHAEINNVLFAPLSINGIVVGLFGLANKPGGFSENDAHMASAFGELAAVTLLNSRTLEALQNSEERFRAVAQTAGDAIITIDSGGTIVFWNKAAETIFGYTADQAVAQPLALIMPERFRVAHQNGMGRLVSTGEPRILGTTVEMIGLRKDGSEFPVELSLSSWKVKGDVFFTGILRDITKRKRAEEEIESLARFPSENRNPVLRVSQDGTIRYANAASAPLLALWARDIGQGLPDALPELVAGALDSGDSRTTQVTDGERVFSLDLAPVSEAGYINLYGRDVTEQVRAETLLRQQNRFIVNVLEALNHPFYVIDANDYTIKMANSAAYQGELPEAVTCYALTHRRSAPCGDHDHPCPLEEIRKTKEPVIVEHIHYDGEGRRRAFEIHGHPVFDNGGNISQIIEYTLDVTERKAMEEALRRERDFTSAVLDTAGALVVVLDPHGRIVSFNRTCERVTGYTFAEVEGKHFWDLFLAPEELEPIKAVFADLTSGKFPNEFENHWLARGGTRRLIAWSNTTLANGAGSVEYIIGTGLDVTEHRQAEDALKRAHDQLELRVEERTAELAQANRFLRDEMAHHKQTAETLRESEERYRRLVELSFEAIMIHSAGKLVYINPAGAELLGATHPEELSGKRLRELIHPDYWDMVQARVQRASKEGKGAPLIEEKLLRLDGTPVEVEAAGIPITYRGRPAVQSVIRDITARKRAEEERERERTRIARDLHDSLGHSLGYLHLKLDQLADSNAPEDVAQLKGELAHMRDVANEAYELVRGMLAALLPSGSTDLTTAMLIQAREIGERGGFEVEVTTDGQPQHLDPIIQQQILYLFQEALINVERHACAQRAHIKMSWKNDHLTIILKDDGRGFDVGGLQPRGHYGLRIMRERAEGMNGRLTLTSRPGTGLEVDLQVPLASCRERLRER